MGTNFEVELWVFRGEGTWGGFEADWVREADREGVDVSMTRRLR